jgi:hypothetical protein
VWQICGIKVALTVNQIPLMLMIHISEASSRFPIFIRAPLAACTSIFAIGEALLEVWLTQAFFRCSRHRSLLGKKVG